MENEKKDLVSIIIPFYNEENYFESSINSALNQTYLNTEIIIVNDGSEKVYEEKLEKFKIKYPNKIKLYTQENKGVSAARNLGLKKASGEYIAFLDADDMWFPNKLEHQIKMIKKHKIDFIHGSYLIINEEGSFIGKFISKTLSYNDLKKSCDVGLSSVLVKSELIKKHFFQKITTKEDYVCWLSIVKEINSLFGDKEEVMIYRDRKKSLSSNITQKFLDAYKVYYIYEKKNFISSIFRTIILSIYWLLKTYNIIYINPNIKDFNYISNVNSLKFDKSFILSALNMASLSNINLFYLQNKKFIFWIDGYCAKFIVKIFNKIPGRKIINNFKLTKKVNKIYLCGKKSEKQIEYLESKFNYNINFVEVPFFRKLTDINKFQLNIDDNSLVIINIATPKQEILALNLLKNNPGKMIYVFCLGGGMSMVAGEEKIVPESIEKMNLEWLWRLRTNTWFRLRRLISTSLGFTSKMLLNYFKKTKFKNID